jgi:hypothetical protein
MFDTRELCVYALDFACNQLYHFGCAGQAGEIGKRDVLLLRELGDVLLVNHYKAAQEWLAVADHDSVGDIGAEFDLILDFGRGEAAAAYRPDSESAERFLPKPLGLGQEPAIGLVPHDLNQLPAILGCSGGNDVQLRHMPA